MHVALVHDYIKEYGGAERVLEALHKLFPEAPIFTLVFLPDFLGPHKERFKNWKVKTSLAHNLPFVSKLISPLRLLAPFLFSQFDLSCFDVVIVSATGAYTPNFVRTKKNGKGAIHIVYCHTPPRYLYGYQTAREWRKNPLLFLFGAVANHFLRLADFASSRKVDYFIANSHEVAKRIQKFYRKEAVVIYPPVNSGLTSHETAGLPEKNYYLAGGRLARAKGMTLIIDAFAKLGKPLKVFGRGFAGFEKELRERAKGSANIEFLGEVDEERKFALMRNARAFVFASLDEDFGITPVEAASVGTPVIAYKSGGIQETVIDGKTGLFFEDYTVESLIGALERFEKMKINPKDCIRNAGRFSSARFEKELKCFIAKIKKSSPLTPS
jgi:glycosyltransferase involved in cell wall biosynthesis